MLASTASVINCEGGSNGDNPTNITQSDVADVVSTLMGNDAYMLTDNIEGQDKFGTGPVRHSYLAMCSTNLTPDLEAINTFIHADNYPSQRTVLRSEWGSVGSVRFCVSSIGSVTQNASNLGADVYNIFVAGLEAKKIGLNKLSLIDLEALRGDKAEGMSHRERLSEKAPQGEATV